MSIVNMIQATRTGDTLTLTRYRSVLSKATEQHRFKIGDIVHWHELDRAPYRAGWQLVERSAEIVELTWDFGSPYYYVRSDITAPRRLVSDAQIATVEEAVAYFAHQQPHRLAA